MPTDATDRLYAYERRRMRDMPDMIAAAERKLAGLYREAARYGMSGLLRDKSFADEAWDHEVRREQVRATLCGEPIRMGNGHEAKYTPDFTYMKGGKVIVEDVKGFIVRDFPLRAAVFRHCYPEIELRVVK